MLLFFGGRFKPRAWEWGNSLDVSRKRLLAEVGLAVAGIIWGVNFVVMKFALGHMPALYYLGVRFLLATALLAPFSVGRLRRLSRAGWLIGIGVGALLFGGFVLQTYGLRTTSPGISGFITGLYVIVVPLMLGIFAKRWPSPLVWVGVVVVLVGLALLSLYGKVELGWGAVLTLLSTIFWALQILGVDYGAGRISSIAFVELQLGTCAVLSLVFSFIVEQPHLFPGWGALGAVAWTGVMGGVVAYVLMVVGQKYTPPTVAGLLMGLEAVFALIASIIVGYDALTLRTLVGFFLVFAGTTVARFGSEREPEMAAEPGPPAP